MAHTMNGLTRAMQTSIAEVGITQNGFYQHHQLHRHQGALTNHYQHCDLSKGFQEDRSGNNSSQQELSNGDTHVTVVQIEQKQSVTNNKSDEQHFQQLHTQKPENNGLSKIACQKNSNMAGTEFVTVLTIASPTTSLVTPSISCCNLGSSSLPTLLPSYVSSSQKVYVDNRRGEIEEEVTIYRLPGERLGMALRFDGGQSVCQTIRRVFVQSISANSPASKAIGLMLGILREGDEILQIDGRISSTLTRHECITLLQDAPVCVRLMVRRLSSNLCLCCQAYVVPSDAKSNLSPCCPPATVAQLSDSINQQAVQKEHFSTATVFVSSSEPLLSDSLASSKKVPPPVPPRMATTTLSIKRKPKQIQASYELSNLEPLHVPEPTSGNQPTEQMPPIEKPPRRKNQLQSGNNPPPLPPRRPKGPPPKPPVDRTVESNSVVSSSSAAAISSASLTATSTKSVPSLVTVITTKVSDVISTTNRCQQSLAPIQKSSIDATISTLPTSNTTCKSNPIKANTTPKVTFTISNSKVSSFIRQTAEKLHRKLSGKSASDENEEAKHYKANKLLDQQSRLLLDETIKLNKICDLEKNIKLSAKQAVINVNNEPTEKFKLEHSSSSANELIQLTDFPCVPSAAIYIDSCNDVDANSVRVLLLLLSYKKFDFILYISGY